MPVSIQRPAVKKGTYPIVITFTDENGDPLTPNSGLNWSLTDKRGNVINSRSAVTIAPAASVTVVLSGDDLDVPAGRASVERRLLIEGDYNSSLGSGLALKEEIVFTVLDLPGVA